MKLKILPAIFIGGIILLGFFSWSNNHLINAQQCSSNCQGFVQACEDGEADIERHADFKYHYNPNTVNQDYVNGYKSGYYFGYYGPYDYCNAKDDRSIGCIFTHWDVKTQSIC
jgi:hypothetical protein